jgi:hypothetical protein
VIRISDEVSNVAGTTLDFGKDDICSWRIIVDSQYVLNKKVILQIDSVYSSSCNINVGYNISTAGNEMSCYNGSRFEYEAD